MKVDISPDFTIEDIHKIREAHDKVTRGMSIEQQAAYYNSLGKEAESEIAKRRAARLCSTK